MPMTKINRQKLKFNMVYKKFKRKCSIWTIERNNDELLG